MCSDGMKIEGKTERNGLTEQSRTGVSEMEETTVDILQHERHV
jgi:hypothetical protein